MWISEEAKDKNQMEWNKTVQNTHKCKVIRAKAKQCYVHKRKNEKKQKQYEKQRKETKKKEVNQNTN